MDYNNALELCYEDIAAVFSGEKQEDDLKLLESLIILHVKIIWKIKSPREPMRGRRI